MSFRAPPLLGALIALATLLLSSHAFAWVEQTVLSHDARVELMRSGSARVQHTVKIRVRGGPLRHFDIEIADQDVAIAGEASFVRTGGAMNARKPIPVSVEQRPDGPLRVEFNGGHGVRRGIYELQVTYDADLLRQEGVTRDGAMLLLSWVGPTWEDGIDNARATFAIPAAPTQPQAVDEVRVDGPEGKDIRAPLGSFLTTLTRLPEFDEIELVRPHVAKGETVRWRIRVDPSVLGEVSDPRLEAPPAPQPVVMSAQRRATYLAVGGAIAVIFSLLLALKHHQVSRSSRIRNATPRPLVPVGVAVRVAFAGPLFAASVAAQVFLEHPLPGSLGILAVAALTAYRTPRERMTPRGPGRWLPLSDADAFRKEDRWPYGFLDAGSALGKLMLALVTIAHGTGVYFLSLRAPYLAHLAALDYLVVLVLFGTGRRTELPADMVRSAAPRLASMAKTLRKSKRGAEARVRGFGRIPTGASDPDELRLAVRPKGTLRGFTSIEIGLGWAHGAGGPVAIPQLLLRVIDRSPCHEAINQRLGSPRWLRGRESYERVMVVNPAIPTEDMAIRFAESLMQIVRKAPAPATTKALGRGAVKPSARPRKRPARRPVPPNERRRPKGKEAPPAAPKRPGISPGAPAPR